jgi:ribonuclease P protein component
VQRNRIRRQVRAALELAGGIPRGLDSVIAVRPGGKVEVGPLTSEFLQILAKIDQSPKEVRHRES